MPRLALSGPDKLALFLSLRTQGPPAAQLAFELGAEFQGLAYFVAAVWVERHGRQRASAVSAPGHGGGGLPWLRSFLYALTCLWVGSMLAWVAPFPMLPFVHTGLMLVFYAMAYRSAREPPVDERAERRTGAREGRPAGEQEERAEAPPTGAGKYQKSRLRAEQVRDIAARLVELCARERPHTDPALTLTALATRLEVSSHALSQVLNERFGKSFHDFVNEARVEAMKAALLSAHASDEKILALGLECGFSTKSTMNNNFKKHTGLTPSQFRGQVARQGRERTS